MQINNLVLTELLLALGLKEAEGERFARAIPRLAETNGMEAEGAVELVLRGMANESLASLDAAGLRAPAVAHIAAELEAWFTYMPTERAFALATLLTLEEAASPEARDSAPRAAAARRTARALPGLHERGEAGLASALDTLAQADDRVAAWASLSEPSRELVRSELRAMGRRDLAVQLDLWMALDALKAALPRPLRWLHRLLAWRW